MSNDFVPLAVYLQSAVTAPKPSGAPQTVRLARTQHAVDPPVVTAEHAETIAAARRFRAALADAVDAAVAKLLDAIARDVLARELQLLPVDIDSLVRVAMERCGAENAVAIRVHPDDLEAIADWEAMLRADGSLQRGDVIIELRSGTLDLRMNSRLEAALDACLP